MRAPYLAFLLLVTFGLGGCRSTYTITHGGAIAPKDDHGVAGVPFYIKKAVCQHETVWAEPVYRLTLVQISPHAASQSSADGTSGRVPEAKGGAREKGDPGDSKPKAPSSGDADFDKELERLETFLASPTKEQRQTIGTVFLTESQYQAKVRGLVSKITSEPQNAGEIRTAFNDLYVLSPKPLSGFPNPEDRFLVSNTSTPITYVAYNDPYYFNVRRPWIGTSTAEVKLANDGTLSEAKGTIESKTIETFLSLLPVKDVLTAVAKKGLDFEAAFLKGTAEPRYEVVVERTVFLHSLSLWRSLNRNGVCDPPVVRNAGIEGYDYKLTEIKAPPESNGQKRPEIDFSGKVALPKKGADEK